MPDLRLAVKLARMLDNVLPKIVVHIHVKVGHGNALRIQKAFKNQLESERIDVGNFHCVSDKRACARTASGAYGLVMLFRPVDKLPHHKKIAGKAHIENDTEFVVRTFLNLFCNFLVAFF